LKTAKLSGRDIAYEFIRSVILPDRQWRNSFISEDEIARQAGVSRTPVREALLILSTEELVQLVPRRGVYVAAPSAQEIHELIEFRRMIEQRAASDPSSLQFLDVELMASLIEEQRKLISSEVDATAFIELDFRFHLTLVASLQNSLVERAYRGLHGRQLRAGTVTVFRSEERQSLVVKEHLSIVAALRTRDAKVIGAVIDQHLDQTLRSMLGFL
jgi:DNA-binding GntR family transcriptional regulator